MLNIVQRGRHQRPYLERNVTIWLRVSAISRDMMHMYCRVSRSCIPCRNARFVNAKHGQTASLFRDKLTMVLLNEWLKRPTRAHNSHLYCLLSAILKWLALASKAVVKFFRHCATQHRCTDECSACARLKVRGGYRWMFNEWRWWNSVCVSQELNSRLQPKLIPKKNAKCRPQIDCTSPIQ